MILRCADGLTNKAVAAEIGVHEHTVGKWRRRFLKERIDGLSDEPRPGRPRTLTDDQVAEVIERTLETTPTDATHWSIRSMARESGLSHTTIRRIWAAFSVQPHRSETFKLSSDPLFVDNVCNVFRPLLSCKASDDRAEKVAAMMWSADRLSFPMLRRRVRPFGGFGAITTPRVGSRLSAGTIQMVAQRINLWSPSRPPSGTRTHP